MNAQLQSILGELRRAMEAIYAKRLVRLVLYGSQARGDAETGSDIDVLVVLAGPVRPATEIRRTGQAVTELSLRYDTVISCVFVAEDRFNTRQGPLLRNIRREGIAV